MQSMVTLTSTREKKVVAEKEKEKSGGNTSTWPRRSIENMAPFKVHGAAILYYSRSPSSPYTSDIHTTSKVWRERGKKERKSGRKKEAGLIHILP